MTFHSEIILVAEDQVLVRMAAVDMLADHGFEVWEAGGADEVLAVLQQRGAEIGVLFTDIQMPGSIDGLQLAHRVRRSWPRIGLLITSGKTLPRSAELPGGSRFLSKAYDLNQMMTQVRELMPAA
jgi:CheY-like chemotaxis protein